MINKINIYQKIFLFMGIVLVILTFVFGKSQYQSYVDLEVFGEKQISHEKYPIVQQRLEDKILGPIIMIELAGILILIYFFRNSKK